MTLTGKMVRLAVSCPSDVEDDVAIVKQVVEEINSSWGRLMGFHVDVVHWRKDAPPGKAKRAQEVINASIFDGMDIYMGMMAARFGTPTGIYASGSEEEFSLAVARSGARGSKLGIMFFFKRYGDLFSGSLEERAEVLKFRKHIGDGGVLWKEYHAAQDLANQLRQHLPAILAPCLGIKTIAK